MSPIVWDGRGQIWRIRSVSIFPTRPRFLLWSAIFPNKWKLKFVLSRISVMDFAHYQSPKLLGSCPLSHINMASLGQTCGDYPIYWQNLGQSAKSKIPDCLGFSWHMKTRLNALYVLTALSMGISIGQFCKLARWRESLFPITYLSRQDRCIFPNQELGYVFGHPSGPIWYQIGPGVLRGECKIIIKIKFEKMASSVCTHVQVM